MMFDVRFFLFLFLRRLHYFFLVMVPVAAAGLALAYLLPPVYRAEARLLVESPQIPGDLAASTVRTTAPEILQVIEQRVLTRANLLDLARRFEVYAGAPEQSADKIVEDMRARITLQLPGAADLAALVTVAFAAPSGDISAKVTNELVTQILEQNVALRTAATSQTLKFFDQEVSQLSGEMAQQGAKILEFKLQNKDALPDSLDYRRARQASQQERLLEMERQLASLRDRRARLVELYERTGRVEATGQPVSPEQRQLQDLRNELATALVIYSPQHQRVRLLKAQIEGLEKEQVGPAGDADKAAVSEGLTAYDLQLGDLDGQMSFLADQKGLIEKELAALAVSIDATPANSIQIGVLERDYDNLRLQYTEATVRLAQARTGDQIEAQSRGQRMTVIEQAVVPEAPTSPNRKKIAVAGVGGGVLLGVGAVALLGLFNSALQRSGDLETQLGMAAFATIPYIRTRAEVRWRRFVLSAMAGLVLAAVSGGLYVVHVHVMPMDMLIARLVDKTGLGPLIAQLRQRAAG